MTYAKGTKVAVGQTRSEIETLIRKEGASRFAQGWEDGAVSIMFEMRERRVRFYLPLPQLGDKVFECDGNGRYRDGASRARVHDQAVRERFRALLLVIKAKLESVASGVTTFEQEFLAHIIVPGGGTVGDWALPKLNEAYKNGAPMPPLLGAGGGPT